MNILAISRAPLLSSEVCVSGAFNLIILSYPLGNFYCLPTPAALRLASSLRGKHPDATSLCDGYLRPTSSKGKTFGNALSQAPLRGKNAPYAMGSAYPASLYFCRNSLPIGVPDQIFSSRYVAYLPYTRKKIAGYTHLSRRHAQMAARNKKRIVDCE